MKRLLSLLGSIGLTATGASSMMAMAPANHLVQAAETITSVTNDQGGWNSHTVADPTNGYDSVHNHWDIDLGKYAPSFDVIKENFQYITLDGNFTWGTFKNPEHQKTLRLVEGKNGDTDDFISEPNSVHFSYNHYHTASGGYQRANIFFTVDIIKKVDGKAMIHLDVQVEAASRAAVQKCSVAADITTISILGK